MSTTFMLLLACLLAYLLGSIPFAILVSRIFGLADPRTFGSQNPGTTNVLRSGNKIAALITLLGDAGKGWLAVFLANIFFNQADVGLIALAVFLGHLFPIFLRFKGGKGVATSAGILLGLEPVTGSITIAIWIAVFVISRYSSLAAICAAGAAPLLGALFLGQDPRTMTIFIIAFMLIYKHRTNIGRLLTQKESKTQFKMKAKK